MEPMYTDHKFHLSLAAGLLLYSSLQTVTGTRAFSAPVKETAKTFATANDGNDCSGNQGSQSKIVSSKRLTELRSLNKLAKHYEEAGQFGKAEPLLMRCLGLTESKEERATTCDNLASLYRSQEKLTLALPWLKKALELRELEEGSNGSGVEASLNNLSGLYHDMGYLNQAVQMTKRAVDIARIEKEKGLRSANLSNNLNSLALLYREQGDKKDTESVFKQVVDLQANDPSANAGDYANNLNNLARLYREQGRFEAAEPLYKHSLILREKAFGSGSAEVGATLRNYAIVLRALNRDTEADELDERASAIEDKM